VWPEMLKEQTPASDVTSNLFTGKLQGRHIEYFPSSCTHPSCWSGPTTLNCVLFAGTDITYVADPLVTVMLEPWVCGQTAPAAIGEEVARAHSGASGRNEETRIAPT